MNPRERGFLLLTGQLGDPQRRPLTVAQLRQLAERVRGMDRPKEDQDLQEADLVSLGYGHPMAAHILELLAGEDLLDHYLRRGEKLGCQPLTRVSGEYPALLRQRLGLESPGCLWALGELELLQEPAVALVGSRELEPENWRFAAEVGRQAARQGYVLISGNARGADRTAQDSCLQAGGRVISVVADQLWKHQEQPGVLYLSENGYDEAFSTYRALSRNRCIHTMGTKTFVAQCRANAGGTWDGTVKNLCQGWSGVYCFNDGSEGIQLLRQLGALAVGMADLQAFYDLPAQEQSRIFPE